MKKKLTLSWDENLKEQLRSKNSIMNDYIDACRKRDAFLKEEVILERVTYIIP